MVLELVTVATSMSPGPVVVVRRGDCSVLIVIGEFHKMSQMDRMTPTRVVIQMAVPRMDLGVLPLTLKFDGNIATCRDVLYEVNLFKYALHDVFNKMVCTSLEKSRASCLWEALPYYGLFWGPILLTFCKCNFRDSSLANFCLCVYPIDI